MILIRIAIRLRSSVNFTRAESASRTCEPSQQAGHLSSYLLIINRRRDTINIPKTSKYRQITGTNDPPTGSARVRSPSDRSLTLIVNFSLCINKFVVHSSVNSSVSHFFYFFLYFTYVLHLLVRILRLRRVLRDKYNNPESEPNKNLKIELYTTLPTFFFWIFAKLNTLPTERIMLVYMLSTAHCNITLIILSWNSLIKKDVSNKSCRILNAAIPLNFIFILRSRVRANLGPSRFFKENLHFWPRK